MGILSSVNHFSIGASLYAVSHSNRDALQGGIETTSLLDRISLATIFADNVSSIALSSGFPLPGKVYYAISTSPFLLNCVSRNTSSKTIKAWSQFFEYRIGDWMEKCFYTILIAQIVIHKQYQAALMNILGAVVQRLLILSFATSARNKKTIAEYLDLARYILNLTFSQNRWLQLSFLCSTIEKVDTLFLDSFYGDYLEKNIIDERNLTLSDFLNTPQPTVIDPKHFHYEVALRETKDYNSFVRSLRAMTSFAENHTWTEEELNAVRASIYNCDHARDPTYTSNDMVQEVKKNEISDENAKAYLIEGLQILVDRVSYESAKIHQGECTNSPLKLKVRKSSGTVSGVQVTDGEIYKALESRLDKIADYVTSSQGGAKHSDIIGVLRILGIDAANYCGSRLIDATEQAENLLFESSSNADKIIYTLLKERQVSFIKNIETDFFKITGTLYPKWLIDTFFAEGTPHTHNDMMKIFGGPIGLDTTKSLQDRQANPLPRFIFYTAVKNANKTFHTEYYKKASLMKLFTEKSTRLTFEKMKNWFVTQGYTNPSDYIDSESGELKGEAIDYFLYKIGVLGLKSNCEA